MTPLDMAIGKEKPASDRAIVIQELVFLGLIPA
jgi:hypothetical protein